MNSEHESQPRGYPWWQWVLGVLTFWPMIAMLVGTIKPSTRSDLTPKRIWLGYGLFCLVSFILLIALVAVIGTQDQVQTAPAVPRVNTQPNPAPAPVQSSKFDCRELELEYQSVAGMGQNMALQHVSNVMMLKDPDGLSFYSAADAERELQRCAASGQSSSAPAPAQPPQFDCRELELEYQSVAGIGYTTALQHVSNVMMLKSPGGGMAFYTAGDAERELKKCGVIP